jgi:hypothetical protein
LWLSISAEWRKYWLMMWGLPTERWRTCRVVLLQYFWMYGSPSVVLPAPRVITNESTFFLLYLYPRATSATPSTVAQHDAGTRRQRLEQSFDVLFGKESMASLDGEHGVHLQAVAQHQTASYAREHRPEPRVAEQQTVVLARRLHHPESASRRRTDHAQRAHLQTEVRLRVHGVLALLHLRVQHAAGPAVASVFQLTAEGLRLPDDE